MVGKVIWETPTNDGRYIVVTDFDGMTTMTISNKKSSTDRLDKVQEEMRG